jgi:Bacterial PH domain/Short C-terminal domain
MSYADGLLSTGERILHRNKQHPFVFIWGARYTILAIVIAVVMFWLGGNLDPDGISGTVRQVLGWITLVLFLGGIAVAIWTALRYLNQEYVLTNRRVIQVEGVLNRTANDSSLEKINDAVLSQSIFGRMFDFGDLTVLTASESGIDKMKMIRGPITFKKQMLDAKHEYEVDMERAGWAPGPPIRDAAAPTTPAVAAAAAATPPQPSVAAAPAPAPPTAAPLPPAAAPAPQAAPGHDADDITRTLASLADLRDRGALSPEEYERKKTDLLGRL